MSIYGIINMFFYNFAVVKSTLIETNLPLQYIYYVER